MKNLGYIKKYLFETIKPQSIHQYFLIDELLNNQEQKFDDLAKKFKQKFDSDKNIEELKTELIDTSLKELSSLGIAKLENGKLVAEFTLKPKSLIDSLHWVIERSIEGYLYKPNQEEKILYEDVISNLKKKYSPKALKPQGKVIYRNANAIMWTLGYIMESRQNGKIVLSKNYAISTLDFPSGPSTWSQYVRWLTWFGLTDRTLSGTEIKLIKAGEELLKFVESNFTVEELKTWSDKPIPEEIKKIYYNQLCSFEINSKSLDTEFTLGSKQIFILLSIAQDGKFFDIRDEEYGTKQQKEIAFEYLEWPKDKKVDFFGWWGKGMSDIGLVELKGSFYHLTDLGKQLIEDIRQKNTLISNKNAIDFSRRNFYFDTNPYISSEKIEKFCLEHNIQEDVVRDIVQSIHYGQKQIVLTGPPGTGKTYILDKITKLFESDEQNKEFVQFHPSYGYEDFVEGLVPDTKDGNLVFANKDGSLKKFLKLNYEKNQKINFYLKNLPENTYKIEAGEISQDVISQKFTNVHTKQPPSESFGESLFLIIDEINRGNLPRIFGELLNLFEYRDEEVTLQYSKSKFSLPSNLYFFGSMNTADRSIKGIDAALRRRFDFINVEPNYEILNKHLESKFSEVNNIAQGLKNLNQQLFQDLKDKSYLIGHTFFMSDQEQITIDEFKAIWSRKIYPQLEEYFFDEPSKLSNYKIENFWPVELEKTLLKKKYKLEILAKDLAEINLELKDEFNKIVNWSKNYKEFDIYLGRREKPSFKTGGGMFIYQKNSVTEGRNQRDKKYHFFRITGKGKFELRLQELYFSEFTRAPFDNQNFRDEFEIKLQKLFQNNNIQIEDGFFEKPQPGIPLESLVKNNCVDQMLSIWDWVIKKIEEF